MPNCLEWGTQRTEECSEFSDKGYDSCESYRDDGYNSCEKWDADCCDWWPCSWACKVVSWICVGWFWITNIVCVVWTWISNVVCVAWVGVTTAICVAFDSIMVVAGAVFETLESTFGWFFSGLAFVGEMFLSIPIVGRFIAWGLAILQSVVGAAVGAVDTIAGWFGVRPEKKLRICTIILADENGRPLTAAATVVPWLQKAVDVFKQEANVRVVPVKPFNYTTGFGGNEVVTDDWIHVRSEASPRRILDIGGEWATMGADLTVIGSDYNAIAMYECFYGTWRKLTGYGSPITIFVIRSVEEGAARSLGPLTDYLVLGIAQGIDVTTVPHEMGHSCYLWHDEDNGNLMYKSSPRGTTLSWAQVTIVRSSRHVTYF